MLPTNIFNHELVSRKLTTIMLELYPLIVTHWGDKSVAELKPDSSWVTSVDRQVEARLCSFFNELLPNAYFLGEETSPKEGGSEQQVLSHDLIIVIDPIDGTREYVHGRQDFGTIVGVCRRQGHELIPFYGFCYRPIVSDTIQPESRGYVVFTGGDGAIRTELSVGTNGDIRTTSARLQKYSSDSPLANKVVSPVATAEMIPSHYQSLASSASVVDLLQPSLGSAGAAISKSRIWDIAGPVAIAGALNFPLWSLKSNKPISAFSLTDFIQDSEDYKWQLREPIVIGAQW